MYNGVPVSGMHQPQIQALFAYLFLHRHTRLSRKTIALRFWPDSSEQQAQTNLMQLLFHLRHVLPDAARYLLIEARTVQWRREEHYCLDVATFEQYFKQAISAQRTTLPSVARGHLEPAISIYKGDLLITCDEDWILPERERLRQLFLGALNQVTRLAEQASDYSGAIAHMNRLIACEPLQESFYLRLMDLYLQNGDRASALRAYHDCASKLDRGLGITPNDEIRTAYVSLTQLDTMAFRRDKAAAATSSHANYIGRVAERRMLQKLWQRTTEGAAFLVLISGESGIGKTRLTEEYGGPLCQALAQLT